MSEPSNIDVVIVGAGLAGLSLARQLLLADDSVTILELDKRLQVPPTGQKVGEATVQVSGYYWSKVLELEEYLIREHYMKYNLRFIWKTEGLDPTRIENYSQSYIRRMSNVASYQLNRNELEGELLRRNLAVSDRYAFDRIALDLRSSRPTAAARPCRTSSTGSGRPSPRAGSWTAPAAPTCCRRN